MANTIFRPAQPVPATWSPSGGWYGAGQAAASSSSSSGRPSWYPSSSYGELPSDAFPSTWAPEDIQRWIKAADAKVAELNEAQAQTTGLEKKQILAQIADLEEGRKNAMEIARIQAQTSRYGTDVQAKTALADRIQRMNEFNQTHALDLQKFGLEYAKTYADYASSPDRYAQGADFRQMAGAALQGQGPAPYGQGVDFKAKTPQDFAALANYGGGNGVSQAIGSSQQGGGGSMDRHGNPKGGGGGDSDPRVKALTTMVKSLPPSSDPGMDANDYAVMQAAQALYSTNLKPGTLQRMRPDQRAIFSSYVKRSGRSWNDFLDDYKRYQPSQGAASAA